MVGGWQWCLGCVCVERWVCVRTQKGSSWVTVTAFLCVRAHRGEASIVIEPLGPVSLIVDVVRHFLEVLEVSPGGPWARWERRHGQYITSTHGARPRARHADSPSCFETGAGVFRHTQESRGARPSTWTGREGTAYLMTKSRSRANSQWCRFSTVDKTQQGLISFLQQQHPRGEPLLGPWKYAGERHDSL